MLVVVLVAVLGETPWAAEGGFSIRGIELGMGQAEARAKLWRDTPYHETVEAEGIEGLQRDLGSTLWNLNACRPTRDAITRAACARIEVHYTHPAIETRVMRIDLTQTLNPAVPASKLREKLVEAHGEPDEETTSFSGFIWKSPDHSLLTWVGGTARFRATIYYYKGDKERSVALTLEAEDLALIEKNKAYLENLTKEPADNPEEQLRF